MSHCDLYRAFDSNKRLLYVGISLSAFNRFRDHRSKSAWAAEMVTLTVERFPSREIAIWEEQKSIKAERPIWNRTHLPKLSRPKRPKRKG